MRFAARERGEPGGVDGSVAASAEVAVQVAEGQVVRGGEAADVGVGGLASLGAGPERERRNPAGLTAEFLVTCSVPSMTAWIAAARISQSRLPIIPPVRWWR